MPLFEYKLKTRRFEKFNKCHSALVDDEKYARQCFLYRHMKKKKTFTQFKLRVSIAENIYGTRSRFRTFQHKNRDPIVRLHTRMQPYSFNKKPTCKLTSIVLTQILENFFLKVSVPFDFQPGISGVFG